MRLSHLRDRGDVKAIMDNLLENLKKNIFGMGRHEMYNTCYNGTKMNIELYHNELIQCLRMLYYYNGTKLSTKDKLKFFK